MQRDSQGRIIFSIKEKMVIALVASGLKNEDIAARVGSTYLGVKNIIRNIYDALGFSKRLELALWYVKHEHDGDIKDWL